MWMPKVAVLASMLAGAFAGQGVHLVNCNSDDSVVVFCNDDSNCNFNPAPNNFCVRSAGGTFIWEQQSSCTFPTGVVFEWNIVPGAQSQNLFTEVGSADNHDANGNVFTRFNVFKDDQHTMYIDSSGRNCKSIYFALPQ